MRRQIEAAPALANENPATRGAIGFRGLSDDSRSLDLINRYDTRYERQYFRAHRRLLDVQNLRKLPPAAGSLPEPRETVLLNEPGNSLKTQIHTPPNPPGTQAAPNPSQDFP
ncbi:MAG TPA: hypothetical protein VG297_23465 [Bryobacteraceae bacterium]|jgi:hypothetical protein|nr:hypothetical protein [Bryobacteraceae bacterium]